MTRPDGDAGLTDLLEHVAISMPCAACGDHYDVPLRKIRVSQQSMRQGCPVPSDRDCPQLVFRDLVDEPALRDLERAWARVRAGARGLQLTWRP